MIVSTQVTTLDGRKKAFVVTLLMDWSATSNPDILSGNLVGVFAGGGVTDIYIQDTFDIRSVLRVPGDIPPIRSVMGTVHFDDFSTAGYDSVLGNGPMILQAPDTGITVAVGPSSNVMQNISALPPTVAGSVITYGSFALPFFTLGTKIVISKICDLYQTGPLAHTPAGYGTISLCTFDIPTFFK